MAMQILDAYKVAATALKSTNAQVTADDVDDAATELQAEMETADSVAAALAEPVTTDGAEDEELLAELAALEVSCLHQAPMLCKMCSYAFVVL